VVHAIQTELFHTYVHCLALNPANYTDKLHTGFNSGLTKSGGGGTAPSDTIQGVTPD